MTHHDSSATTNDSSLVVDAAESHNRTIDPHSFHVGIRHVEAHGDEHDDGCPLCGSMTDIAAAYKERDT